MIFAVRSQQTGFRHQYDTIQSLLWLMMTREFETGGCTQGRRLPECEDCICIQSKRRLIREQDTIIDRTLITENGSHRFQKIILS